eukprot:NODE_117_length_18329_cov_0.420954.p7 type:complete len:217 gc:universal NODE_117_length_18329_cov_0.420954:15952-15302(-)
MGKKKSPKIFRWIESIQKYEYEAFHIAGASNQLADMLSRIDHAEDVDGVDDYDLNCNAVESRSKKRARLEMKEGDQPVENKERPEILETSKSDPIKMDCHCQNPATVLPLECARCGLCSHKSCVDWEFEVFQCKKCLNLIMPTGEVSNPDHRKTLIQKAHYTHPGIQGMKILLRKYHWNTKMNDIENMVKNCEICKMKSRPVQSKYTFRKPRFINQ